LEEKVRREVERRKDSEGAMKRLNQATAEQKGRWEDMAGWALDVGILLSLSPSLLISTPFFVESTTLTPHSFVRLHRSWNEPNENELSSEATTPS